MKHLLRALFFVRIFMLSGCPRPVPPPPPPPLPHLDLGNIPACTLDAALPKTEDVCTGWFTERGLICVACPASWGCIDTIDVVYCIRGDASNCGDGGRCRPSAAGAHK